VEPLKTRVGLGLPGATPGGRLVSATARGDAVPTVRLPPTGPDEVDDEVLDRPRTANK